MVAQKYSASMDEELLEEVKRVAEEEDMTLSAFLAEAARHRVRLLIGRQVIDEYERENGPFTEEELAEADAWLDSARDPEEIMKEIEAEEKKKASRNRKSA